MNTRVRKSSNDTRAHSIRDQLSRVRANLRKYPVLPNPNKLGIDGESHINVSMDGKTDIGRQLAIDYAVRNGFSVTGVQRFKSIRSFWEYITTEERDDRIPMLSGKSLRDLVRNCNRVTVKHLPAIIMDAYHQRLLQDRALLLAFKETTLPIDSYFFPRDNPTNARRTGTASWLIAILTELRAALQENRHPDVDKFKEDNTDLYVSLGFPHPQPVKRKPRQAVPSEGVPKCLICGNPVEDCTCEPGASLADLEKEIPVAVAAREALEEYVPEQTDEEHVCECTGECQCNEGQCSCSSAELMTGQQVQ